MKAKAFFSLSLICIWFHSRGQQVTKIINMGIYKSYYSSTIKNPLYVTYPLYKGGGPCDRRAEGFSFTQCGEQTATGADYSHSGYEKGHLANAEDFVSSCVLEKNTFCYCNCVPQTFELNRGKWKTWEKKIRDLFLIKPLFIVTGSIFATQQNLRPNSAVLVPTACYKIVLGLRTQAVLYCMLFYNDHSNRMENLSLAALKQRLVYPLLPDTQLSLQ